MHCPEKMSLAYTWNIILVVDNTSFMIHQFKYLFYLITKYQTFSLETFNVQCD